MRFIEEIVKNMDKFLGMSFRQFATTTGVLNDENIHLFPKLRKEPIDPSLQPITVHEELLTQQIKTID